MKTSTKSVLMSGSTILVAIVGLIITIMLFIAAGSNLNALNMAVEAAQASGMGWDANTIINRTNDVYNAVYMSAFFTFLSTMLLGGATFFVSRQVGIEQAESRRMLARELGRDNDLEVAQKFASHVRLKDEELKQESDETVREYEKLYARK